VTTSVGAAAACGKPQVAGAGRDRRGPKTSPAPAGAAAWADRADDLAAWAWQHLVNRTDAWGEYPAAGGQATAYGTLTPARLARHFRAEGRGDLLGLHPAGPDNRGLGGAVDIDAHGPGGNDPAATLAAALHWHTRLADYGFTPLLYASNGGGGFHLRLLLARPADASAVHRFLRHLTADHRDLGLTAPPEVFPKQLDVRRCKKQLGNWLRLPGRHHTRAFWSRVWGGRGQWLEGGEAVQHLLSLAGDDPGLLPPTPPTPPPAAVPARPRAPWRGGGANLSARIAAFVSRQPNLGAGQGRTAVAFKMAAYLARDLALPDAVVLAWMLRWDSNNSPPLGQGRLREVLGDAHDYGTADYGAGLAPAAGPAPARRRAGTHRRWISVGREYRP
jgi:hypothetical protein